MGLFKSLLLSTLPSPTSALLKLSSLNLSADRIKPARACVAAGSVTPVPLSLFIVVAVAVRVPRLKLLEPPPPPPLEVSIPTFTTVATAICVVRPVLKSSVSMVVIIG